MQSRQFNDGTAEKQILRQEACLADILLLVVIELPSTPPHARGIGWGAPRHRPSRDIR